MAATVTVTSATGRLAGAVADGVLAFKGIPYAAPPLGERRWRPPHQPAGWKGTREACQYGPDCAQFPYPLDLAPLRSTCSEDCLYLNVWTPALDAKLPVMVWIHGGGWVNGGSSPAVYDGAAFARDGVVLVSFNYRLGRFGFFAHPALDLEHPELVANYGYMDQIAALRWVNDNIPAFGGDPANVTVCGESAGGGAVHALLMSPLARGLFHKAIVQSGVGRNGGFGAASLAAARAAGAAFARSRGIDGVDATALARLRALPAEALAAELNIASLPTQAPVFSGPALDGILVAAPTGDGYRAARQMKIPLIVGANDADLGFADAPSLVELYAPFGPHAVAAAAAYDPERSRDLSRVAPRVAADRLMVEPARFVARQVAAAGAPAWQYRFAYVAESKRQQWPGAVHASEIPYVFNTVRAHYREALTPADAAAAQTVHAYWVNFARHGDPNGARLPPWPRYVAAADVLMTFTNQAPRAVPDPWKTRLDLTEMTTPSGAPSAAAS